MLDLFVRLYEQKMVGEAWLFDETPAELRAAIFDNPFVESLEISNALLLKHILCEEQREYWDYILNEWQLGDRGFHSAVDIIEDMLACTTD